MKSTTTHKSTKEQLTFKQKLFCQYYLETLGNGTEAVIKAGYEVKRKNGKPDRSVARKIASENLTKPDISSYINSLLEKYGFTDDMVAKQHLFLINQFADLSVKVRAIDIYYKIKGKYAPTKVEGPYDVQIEEATIARITGALPG